jgi:hypothetical protein
MFNIKRQDQMIIKKTMTEYIPSLTIVFSSQHIQIATLYAFIFYESP